MKRFSKYLLGIALLLAGSAAGSPVDVDPDEVLTYLGPGVRPDHFLFPRYLLVEGTQIGRHGPIRGTPLVAAELKSWLDLPSIQWRFGEELRSKGWKTRIAEQSPHAFRMEATKGDAFVEIRAVRGTGPARLLLLFRPGETASS